MRCQEEGCRHVVPLTSWCSLRIGWPSFVTTKPFRKPKSLYPAFPPHWHPNKIVALWSLFPFLLRESVKRLTITVQSQYIQIKTRQKIKIHEDMRKNLCTHHFFIFANLELLTKTTSCEKKNCWESSFLWIWRKAIWNRGKKYSLSCQKEKEWDFFPLPL